MHSDRAAEKAQQFALAAYGQKVSDRPKTAAAFRLAIYAKALSRERRTDRLNRLIGPLNRHVEADDRADARLPFHAQLAAVHLDHGLWQGHAQADSFSGPGMLALYLFHRAGHPHQ